jgi:hypothetical protein
MSQVSRRVIRIECDFAKATSFRLKDKLTSNTPELWRGNDVQFELAILKNATLIDSVANLASLTVDIKSASDKTGAALATKTITSFSVITQANWDDGTAQNALVTFTAAEMNFAAGTHWIAVSVETNDSPGRSVTLGCSDFILTEDGAGTTDQAQVNDGLAYTKDQADARYQQRWADGASIQFKDGQHPYLYCADNTLWYPLVVRLVDGTATLSLGTGEAL